MLLSSLYAVVSISIVTVIATAIFTAFFFLLLLFVPSLSHPCFVSHPFHICMLFLAINSLDFLFRLQTLPHITMHNLFLSPSQ